MPPPLPHGAGGRSLVESPLPEISKPFASWEFPIGKKKDASAWRETVVKRPARSLISQPSGRKEVFGLVIAWHFLEPRAFPLHLFSSFRLYSIYIYELKSLM